MLLFDEYKCRLASVFLAAKMLCSHEQPEFKRHVESWHSIFVDLRSGKVVNRAVAFGNYPTELAQASFGSILYLESTPRQESARCDAEVYCFKYISVLVVERAIYENRIVRTLHQRLLVSDCFA
jgi:hypothetical protein